MATDIVSLDPASRGASPTNSAWNHFGRMGIVARVGTGGVGDGVGDAMATFPFAFSLALSYDETPAQTVAADRARRLFFPVNPEVIGLPLMRSVSGVDVLSSAQNTQVGNTQLRSVTFESMFPMAYDGDYCNPVPQPGMISTSPMLDRTPRESVEFIEASMTSTSPLYLHFIAGAAPGQVALPPALPCFVSAFDPRYQAGHPLDIFFSIELTEYRPPVAGTRVNVKGKPKGSKDWPADVRRTGGVTTNRGQYATLAKIAARIYGNGFSIGWRQLKVDSEKANGKRLLTTKNRPATGPSQPLKAGQRIVVKEFRGVGL